MTIATGRLEQVQQKQEPVLRPQARKDKERAPLRVSTGGGNPLTPLARLLARSACAWLHRLAPAAIARAGLVILPLIAIEATVPATAANLAPSNQPPPDQPPSSPLIVMLTEPNPPYAFQAADGSYHGLNIDQVEAIAADAGVAISIDIVPWARALATGETEPMHCVFSTARTPEREARFKWVAPLGMSRRILVKRAGAPVAAASLQDARQFIVGTYRDDFSDGLFRRLEFPNIDMSPDVDTMLRKLIAGHIDLMPMSENAFRKIHDADGSIERVVTLTQQPVGIACHRSVPDAVIARLQKSLDSFLSDGRQQSVYQRYGFNWPP
ncbi:MAG: transporter substrate-binding domain-containing protein [Neorhizobium sp.]|nr:transporter substrate-binding domain-containing protein [Neorhizobium sp.]